MTTDLMGSLLAAKDASVEALGGIWGARDYRRRTRGDARRTRALAALDVMDRELGIPQAGHLARVLADAWASEEGWDTAQLIRALGATKGQPHQLVTDDRRRGGRE